MTLWARFRNALRSLLPHDRERLEALEAAHQELAQRVAYALDDRIAEGDKLYARVHSALGRIYRLKGWEDERQEAAAEATRPSTADVLAAKFRRQ